jgi:hypothetical protein
MRKARARFVTLAFAAVLLLASYAAGARQLKEGSL